MATPTGSENWNLEAIAHARALLNRAQELGVKNPPDRFRYTGPSAGHSLRSSCSVFGPDALVVKRDDIPNEIAGLYVSKTES